MATTVNWGMNKYYKNVALSAEEAAKSMGSLVGAFNQANVEQKIIQQMAMGEDAPVKQDEGNPFRQHLASEALVYYPRHSSKGDYSENTHNVGNLQYTNIKSLLARFFIGVHANYGRIRNWRDYCIGAISYINNPPRDMHMPMFDYDGRNVKTRLKKDVKKFQQAYGLGDAWVYNTRRGFHVYFFTDAVPWDEYRVMLEESAGCKGFQVAANRHTYGTLRVSAKYTKFDISLEYVLRSQKRYPKRMIRKAVLIQELLKMGQSCGTHLTSLFPQWAQFYEDETEWRGGAEKKGGGRMVFGGPLSKPFRGGKKAKVIGGKYFAGNIAVNAAGAPLKADDGGYVIAEPGGYVRAAQAGECIAVENGDSTVVVPADPTFFTATVAGGTTNITFDSTEVRYSNGIVYTEE